METEQIKTSAERGLQVVKELVISNVSEYSKSVEIGTRLKEISNTVKNRKEEITKPLNEALKSARDLFKPIEESLEEAGNTLKSKMLVWKDIERKEAEKIQKEEQAKIEEQEAKLKSGEVTAMQAHQSILDSKIEIIKSETEKTTKTNSGARATEKFITEYVVVDKTKIPLDFLEPDMVKIKNSFKEGTPIEGVEARKKAIISF